MASKSVMHRSISIFGKTNRTMALFMNTFVERKNTENAHKTEIIAALSLIGRALKSGLRLWKGENVSVTGKRIR